MFVIFTIFLTSSSSVFAEIEDCLNDSRVGNGLSISLNDDIACNSGYAFGTVSNFKLFCNNHSVRSSNADFSTIGSLIEFHDCNFLVGSTYDYDFRSGDIEFYHSNLNQVGSNILNIVEDGSTTINFYNQIDDLPTLKNKINFSSTLGEYHFGEKIEFNVIDTLGIPITVYDVVIVSSPTGSNFDSSINDYVEIFDSVAGSTTDYNNFSGNLSSSQVGSNTRINNINFRADKTKQYILNDSKGPNVTYSSLGHSNISLNFEIKFNEIVNGYVELRNRTTDEIIYNVSINNKNAINVSFFNLYPNTEYRLNIDARDRHDNSLDIVFPDTTVKTYVTLNYTILPTDHFSYQGDPQNVTWFAFWSNPYQLVVNISNINITNMNFSKEINIFNDTFIYLNSSSKFNSQAQIQMGGLTFNTVPTILKNGLECISPNCEIVSYSNSSGNLIFNVTGFSNYTVTTNSYLEITNNSLNQNYYYGFPFEFYINYSMYNTSSIVGAICDITTNYNKTAFIYNSTSKTYSTVLIFENNSFIEPFSLECMAPDFDFKNISSSFNLISQPIDDFSAILDINESALSTTETKIYNITINSDGSNNTNPTFGITYSFQIIKNKNFPEIGWNTSNITSWIDIGKNEFFKLFTMNGSDKTYVALQNGTLINFSEYIFIDEWIGSVGTSVSVVVRACAPGNFCKYNSTDYVIFSDTTNPELVGESLINFPKYYNNINNINFTFRVRDLESKLSSVKYLLLNSSGEAQSSNISIPFIENQDNTHFTSEVNFNEGKRYQINLNVLNKNDMLSVFPSEIFLIDTLNPINSTFNISNQNIRNYLNSTIISMNFDAGVDNSNHGLNVSGLDFMKISVINSTLSKNTCINSNSELDINISLNETNTSYSNIFSDAFCYQFKYYVYDKAGNVNIVTSNQVKIDTTNPVPSLLNEFGVTIKISTNSVKYNKNDLDQFSYLFNVKWNITDDESGMNIYSIILFDETDNIYYNISSNYTQSQYNFYYDEIIFKDGHKYKAIIKGMNNADLWSNNLTSNGVNFFIEKTPNLILKNVFLLNSTNPEFTKVLDLSNNNETTIYIQEKFGFNITCRWDTTDIGYSDSSGTACLGGSESNSTCIINTTSSGFSEYYISCKNSDVLDTENSASNNLDIQIYVEENKYPEISEVNSNISYSQEFSIKENDTYFELDLKFADSNSFTYYLANYTKTLYDNLTLKANISEYIGNQLKIDFIQKPDISKDYLKIDKFHYIFYFKSTTNHSNIINQNNNAKDSIINILSTNLSKEISGSGQNFTLLDTPHTILGGISNNISNISIFSNYNFSLENFAHDLTYSRLIWNASEFTQRIGQVNFTISLSDSLGSKNYTFFVNITPIYYAPKINEFYKSQFGHNNILIYNNKYSTLNLSKYFTEDNSGVGNLNGNLTFSLISYENFTIPINGFNSSTGILKYKAKSNFLGPTDLIIIAHNVENMYNLTTLSFNVIRFNSTPSINLTNPQDSQIIISQNNFIDFEVNSNVTLSSVDVILNGMSQNLCIDNISCNSSFNESVFLFGLTQGNNSLEVIVTDEYGNTNSKTINFMFEYDIDKDSVVGDLDDDGDGINDSQDPLIGSHDSYFKSNNASFIYVNSSLDLGLNFNSSYNVEFINENNITLVEFEQDFASSQLDLRGVGFVYDNTSNSIVISNLNISGFKTIYLPKSENPTQTSVCIKDSNILSINEISSSCSDTFESILVCDTNQSGNAYACESDIQNTTQVWKITGLKHSGIKLMCTEEWTYGNWSTCVSNSQTRTATDTNSCGTTYFRDTISQSCTVPDSGDSSGSSSGGGSSGGSSNSSSNSHFVIVNKTTTSPPSTEPVTIPTENNETSKDENLLPIYIGNLLEDSFSKQIELGKLYSFKGENGNIIEGVFSLENGDLLFKTKNGIGNFLVREKSKELDIDNDGKNDIKLSYTKDADLIYLSGLSLEAQNLKKNEFEEDTMPQNIENKTSPINLIIIIFVILFIITLIGIVGYIGYRKFYLKDTWENIYSINGQNIDSNKILGEQKLYEASIIAEKTFEQDLGVLKDEFDRNIQYLNGILSKIESEFRNLVRKGFSWVDIYFFLKHKKISIYFIKKIINFEYLAINFELFFHKYSESGFGAEEIKNKLLNEKWINECYFYDGNGKDILRDLLFMLAGANIYGFSKKKFLNILNDEFDIGLRKYSKTLKQKDFDKMELNIVDISQLTTIESRFRALKTKITYLDTKLHETRFNDFKMREYEQILDIIKKNLEIYTKE